MQFGIAADFDLSIVDTDGAEVFGEPFVEPSLSGRIVVIKQHVSEVVGHLPPGFLFEQTEDYKVLVLAGKKEAWGVDGLSLAQRRDLVIGFVILEGKDCQR